MVHINIARRFLQSKPEIPEIDALEVDGEDVGIAELGVARRAVRDHGRRSSR